MKEEVKLLVEQARDGSERAFNKLYEQYKKIIWATAYQIVRNTDIADDIVSIVFTKAYMKLDTYTEHISFEMWLKTITINTAIDYIRRNKKEHLNNYIDEEDNPIQLSGLERSPEEALIDKQNLDVIKVCIERLRGVQQIVLKKKLEGLTYKQIAEELALPEITIKGYLNRARQRLKYLFNNY